MYQSMDMRQQCHQPTWREGRFRLVQQVDSIAAETVSHQCKETLSVGLRMERARSIAYAKQRSELPFVGLVDIAGRVVKAFGPQKEAVLGIGTTRKGQMPVQSEWVALVEKLKLQVPPSALKPYATAIASSRVDFPVPFLPTKKVTGCEKVSASIYARWCTTGRS